MKKVKKTRKSAKVNKGAAKLKKIVAAAKKIYKAHPASKWTNCIKQAAKACK
jgi:hypothetical protein